MNRKFFLILLSVLLINKADAQPYGLLKPITLDLMRTTIDLQDLVLDIKLIDSIQVHKSLRKSIDKEKKRITIMGAGNRVPAVSEMKLWMKGKAYTCILLRSRKENKMVQLTDTAKKFSSVKLAGDFNGWNPDKNELRFNKGKWVGVMQLNPGNYLYQVVVDGKWKLDPNNKDSAVSGTGSYNSVMHIGKPAQLLPQITPQSVTGNTINIAIGRQRMDSCVVLWENTSLDTNAVKRKGNILSITIPASAASLKKSMIRVYGYSRFGMSNDVNIPLANGKVQMAIDNTDMQNMIMYFALVDRFNNGNKTNDNPVKDKDIAEAANYQGGDLAGITAKIKDGYFDKLGINTIWISPIVQNPEIGYVEYPEPHRKYSGYHGYWPISSTKIDHRFGTDAELKELVKEAHAKNMRVLIDFVSNHIHEEHPIYKKHKDWTTPIDLPNGKKNIRIWDEQRLTTWFDTFLPDLDYTKPEVINAMTDSAVWWIKTYNLDGFRHDATKHVSEDFWRALTLKLKKEVEVPMNKKLYQIGETFGSRELIGSYVNNGEQDAQFDFNTYFDARNIFADSTTSFKNLAESLQQSFEYYGSNNLMGNITGNHDLARFISYASGAMSFKDDDRKTAWEKKIKVENPIGYKRLQQLMAFNMTIPGVPVIYYADEYGMLGAGDPDNRRMMQFANLTPDETKTLETTSKLANIRKKSLALNYGTTQILFSTNTELVIGRSYFDDVVITVFNKSNKPKLVNFILPPELASKTFKGNFGQEANVQGNRIMINMNANSFEMLSK